MQELDKLENLLMRSRSINSRTFEPDQEFKDSLHEKLYQRYLNQSYKGASIMAKVKSIVLNRKLAFSLAGIFVVVSLVAGGAIFLLAQKKDQEQSDVLLAANLAITEGQVDIRKKEDGRWMEALEGDVLRQGDSIKTSSESKAVLELDNGDAIRLNAESEVILTKLDPDEVVIDQVKGESYNRVAKSDENTFSIRGQGVTASALGTAYIFSSDQETQQVAVYVYESKVRLNTEEEEREVGELNKAVVDLKNNKFEVVEMSQEEYAKEFANWNLECDRDKGYDVPEQNLPIVEITEPESGITTENEAINIKGKITDESELRKIKVAGTIYTSKDENNKGFDPEDGTFDVDVALKTGENTIEVVAFDIYWNASAVSKIVVTRQVIAEPAPSTYFYVSHVSSPEEGKIYVKWDIAGYSAPHGFKVIKAVGHVPVYPGDSIKYVSSGTRELTWAGLSAGTYNIRVCIYNGNGGCTRYTSNYKTITVSSPEYCEPLLRFY